MYARFVIAPTMSNTLDGETVSDIDYWPRMPTTGCGSSSTKKWVYGGNPRVNIDPAFMGTNNPLNNVTYTEESPWVLDFTQVAAAHLNTEIGYNPLGTGGVGHSSAKTISPTVVRYTETNGYWSEDATNHPDSARCENVPDPEKADFRSRGWIYSPYYEGRLHPNWDPSSRSYLDAPIFGKVDTGVYRYRIHDRRFMGIENTPENPIGDGGGQQTLDSVFIDMANPPNDTAATLVLADHDENPRK